MQLHFNWFDLGARTRGAGYDASAARTGQDRTGSRSGLGCTACNSCGGSVAAHGECADSHFFSLSPLSHDTRRSNVDSFVQFVDS